MMSMFFFLAFVLGAIIASFLNVVRMRGSWTSSFKGRSKCDGCNKQLNWYELIPIISFIVLRGKCSSCDSKLDKQYLIIELLMGLLFASAFLSNDLLFILSILIPAIFLLPISFEDIKTREVQFHLSIPFILISLLYAFYIFFQSGNLNPIIIGLIFFILFFSLWFFSKGKALGLGDAKIILALGFFFTSFNYGLLFFFSIFWISSILVILIWLIKFLFGKKEKLRGQEIPLVPYIALAYFLIKFIELYGGYSDLFIIF